MAATSSITRTALAVALLCILLQSAAAARTTPDLAPSATETEVATETPYSAFQFVYGLLQQYLPAGNAPRANGIFVANGNFVSGDGGVNMNINFFAQDTGYKGSQELSLRFDKPDFGRQFCSRDGVWCVTVRNFFVGQGAATMQFRFGNRNSKLETLTAQGRVDCKTPIKDIKLCSGVFVDHGFNF